MFNPYAYNQIIISQESPNSISHKPSQPIRGATLEAHLEPNFIFENLLNVLALETIDYYSKVS